jgi:hypothetical protein
MNIYFVKRSFRTSDGHLEIYANCNAFRKFVIRIRSFVSGPSPRRRPGSSSGVLSHNGILDTGFRRYDITISESPKGIDANRYFCSKMADTHTGTKDR